MFSWEKYNFEPIGNSAHYSEFLYIYIYIYIYIGYLMFYPSRQHVKRKHLQAQVLIQL